MGDYLVLLIDHLHTESTLEAAIKSGNSLTQARSVAIDETMIYCSSHINYEASFSPTKLVECRICQDEDVDSNMETPCSCCGSLKYAHRKCIQRWCDEKGDTVCEICHQQFKPGYTAPPRVIHIGGLPMNLRGNWHIGRRELNNPHIITMVSTDPPSFLVPDYDEYAVSTSRSTSSCRSVAIIFMLLLVLRHTLPVIVSRAGNYSFPLIFSLTLRAAGMILPVCMILIAVTSILHHLRQQEQDNESMYPGPSDEEAGPLHRPLGGGILYD